MISVRNTMGMNMHESKCVLAQAYGFVEVFAGFGWISAYMRANGRGVASMDILYGETMGPGEQNRWDLTTDAGFLKPCL